MITLTSRPSLLQELDHLIAADFTATNHLISQELISDVPLIREVAQHIINSGGKRLRPKLLLLTANALRIKDNEHHELAAVIEFIHTATLLHDDVVDNSELRRGHETAHTIWGNKASVLVGDFLYSRAFQILAKRNNVPVMKVLAHATNALSEGEVMQLANQNCAELTEQQYYATIARKTAKLFEAASLIGVMLASVDLTIQQAFASYGFNLGMAYQIVDDCMDYSSENDKSGKNIGNDFKEGKVTLPLIYAFKQTNSSLVKKIKHAINTHNTQYLADAKQLIQQTGAIEYCLQQAKNYIATALQALDRFPSNDFLLALRNLAEFVIMRDY